MVKEYFARQLWISFGIILGSIAIVGVAAFFMLGDISKQASTIVSDRTMIEEKNDAVTDLAELEAQVAQAAQYEQAITQLLPTQFGLVSFPQWLAQLGSRYSVTTTATLQGSVAPPTGSSAGTVGFAFSAVGSPSNVTAFLDAMISKSPGFLASVNSFNVTGDATNETVTGQGMLFFQ